MSDVFFGIQVAVRAPGGDPWRQRLLDLLRSRQRDLALDDQRGFHGQLANLLLEAQDRMPLGFWDFVPDGRTQFAEWVQGIEDDTGEPWVPDPSGARMDHVLVSALFLLPVGGTSAERVGERCDLPESQWRTRRTWRNLIETPTQLDWSSVRSSAVYATPGDLESGFSLRELTGEGYEYLLPIE